MSNNGEGVHQLISNSPEVVRPTPAPRRSPLPPTPSSDDHDYSVPMEAPLPPKPRPPHPQPSLHADAVYDNEVVGQHRASPRTRVAENEYDDPHSLGKVPPVNATCSGDYDNPDEVIEAAKRFRSGMGGDDTGAQLYDNAASVCDTEARVHTTAYSEATPTYETPPEESRTSIKWKGSHAPKFDDTIYAVRSGEGSGSSKKGGPLDRMGKLLCCQPSRHCHLPPGISCLLDDVREALPSDPLSRQWYYHGIISRDEAEALLEADGDFLVRESSKRAGQYVLTGIAGDQIQHLLLVDRQGKVRTQITSYNG